MAGYVKLDIDESIPAKSIVLRLNYNESSYSSRNFDLDFKPDVLNFIIEYWIANKYQPDPSLINSQSKKK